MVQLTSRNSSVPVERTALPAAGAAGPGRGGGPADLLRRLVHRTRPQDVFPTGLTRLTDTQFSVSAHWPRAHSVFAPVGGSRQDPLLIAETMRQSAMLIAHAEFGVPVGDAFVMWDLRYTAAPERLLLGEDPWDITVDVSCSDVRRRGRGLGSMTVEYLLHRSGVVLASGDARMSRIAAAAYHRLRGHRAGTPAPLLPALAPGTVGRVSERDVVLGPAAAPGRWPLRLDTRHPTLFGRPNDHVPGLLLMEAARQAATACAPALFPASMRADFLRYVELDLPCWIEARPAPAEGGAPDAVLIRAVQDGATVFTCALGPSDPGPYDGGDTHD